VTVTTRAEPGRVVAALGGQVDGHALDLSDADSVRRFARWYGDAHGALDVLVNNAGVHLDLLSQWKQPKLSADGQEVHWRINYLGTVHLTRLLLPALLTAAHQRGGARVVNVVSRLHAKGSNAALFEAPAKYDSWAAYGTSKLALMHDTLELQSRYGADGIRAYCLHPGAVFTNIADKGLAGNPRLEAVRRAFAPVEAFFLLTPEEGAQTSVHCATSPGAEGGRYYSGCRPAETSADAQDAEVAGRLWQRTAQWLEAQT
jgi:NAD(P)-dependent dehydrogenase (short-subunit alcohol dehydrogenase family)